jgi:hypothetical protein
VALTGFDKFFYSDRNDPACIKLYGRRLISEAECNLILWFNNLTLDIILESFRKGLEGSGAPFLACLSSNKNGPE